MTYLKAMGQGHILTYTLKVHNLGGTKLSKFSKFNTADTKNWRPWNFRGFLINWIYLSETLLGPTGHFFNGQKRQKRAERFWFGVFFTCFCLSVFYVTLFLDNIFQYFLMKFWRVVLGITLVVSTFKQCHQCAGDHFGVFWGPILAYMLIFLDICSIFCHEILFSCSWHNFDYH